MPIDTLLKSTKTREVLTGFMSGAAGGALASSLTRKKSAKKMLKAGGLIALGGVAWHAYQRYQKGSTTSDAGAGTGLSSLIKDVGMDQHPNVEQLVPNQDANATANAAEFEVTTDTALLMLKSMIAAAYADGQLTAAEQGAIWRQAAQSGLSPAALAELEGLLNNPPSQVEIVAQTRSLEEKIEAYCAAMLVVDEQCTAGQQYLASFATQLELPAGLVSALSQEQTDLANPSARSTGQVVTS